MLLVPALAGISIVYDQNLNRYNIITVSPAVGTTALNITSANNIAPALHYTQYNTNTTILLILTSDPKIIDVDGNGNLYVALANPGDFGSIAPLNLDTVFGNCILSNVVLIECSIYLSLGILNGDTLQILSDNPAIPNIPPVFCQIPNNTLMSSIDVKTIQNQPCVWSGIQFYNPPLSKLLKLDINWYSEEGELINILDNCFTIRIYYFQKRNNTTAFSTGIFNYAASGTIDSIFQN